MTDTTPSGHRQARALLTRDAILDGAAAEFVLHGYHAASLSRIIERSKVTKGALYFHFASKQEMALALIDGMEQSFRALTARTAGRGLDPLRESAHLARGVQDVLEDPRVRAGQRICGEGVGGPAWATFPPRFWEQVFTGLFHRARADGIVRPEIDPAALARHVVDFSGGSFRSSLAVSGLADLAERVRFNFEVMLGHAATPAWLEDWRAEGGMAAVLGEHLTRPRAEPAPDLL